MAQQLAGRVALITGAGVGIGRAIAERFATEGATVVATSKTMANIEETLDVVRAAGGESVGLTLDVRDRSATNKVVGEVIDRFGRIDVVVANAGIDLADGPAIEETTDEDWDRVIDVNIGGVFRICRAAIPHMPAGGSIVTVGSINSFVAWQHEAVYTATKGAVLQLTRAIALDVAPRGLRANCLCPGVIDTPLTRSFLTGPDAAELEASYSALAPMNRMGTPEEIAAAALFLASSESSFMTGAALIVDGGLTAR